MYHTILVPLDGSSLAERALPYARSLAVTAGAELILLRVVEPSPGFEPTGAEDEAKRLTDAEEYLAGFFPGPNEAVPVVTSVFRGDAADGILDEIRSRRVDLVVMSTHGRSGLSRAVYGSVAERVCHHATVPVLLVTAGCARTWQRDPRPKIMVPLDGSELAETALGQGENLADALDATMLLVRVAAPPEYVTLTYPDEPRGVALEIADTRKAEDYLNTIAANSRAHGRDVAARVVSGDPVPTILALADEEGVDAIVMATHGRGGVARVVMGSVATGVVLGSTVPVLLWRPPAIQALMRPSEEEATRESVSAAD